MDVQRLAAVVPCHKSVQRRKKKKQRESLVRMTILSKLNQVLGTPQPDKINKNIWGKYSKMYNLLVYRNGSDSYI